MAKKNIFITGASGFIGRNLIEKLSSKYEISAPSSKELDLLDSSAVEKHIKSGIFDVVVHCANVGGTRNKPVENLVEKNLKMFFNVAGCLGHFGKMIHLGSGAEYDKSRPLVRVKENEFGSSIPKDEYGLYKYKCSKHIEATEGITCLRIFGCFGKYEDYEIKFISNAIAKAVLGMPITIANRNVVFSYLYINDFVRIVEHFIEHKEKEKFYNVVPDETSDLLSIANLINKISRKSLPISVKKPGFGPEYSGDNSLLKAEIPSFRFTPLSDAVEELYLWNEKNKPLLSREKLIYDP